MSTALLSLSGIAAAIYNYWTGLIFVIYNLALTGNIYAATYIVGLGAIFFIGVNNLMKTGGRKFVR